MNFQVVGPLSRIHCRRSIRILLPRQQFSLCRNMRRSQQGPPTLIRRGQFCYHLLRSRSTTSLAPWVVLLGISLSITSQPRFSVALPGKYMAGVNKHSDDRIAAKLKGLGLSEGK